MRHARSSYFGGWIHLAAGVGLASAALAAAACGHGQQVASGGSRLPQGAHSETVEHEACSESGHYVEPLDTNGDAKPDISRVLDKKGGRELCRIADLNHDGKSDLYEYFDSDGLLRRREFCYDDTGVVNAVEYFEGGKLARREYDTGGQHRLDTWDWFDTSAPVDPKTGYPAHPSRRERDTTGNGQTDQWWTWNGDKITIAFDRTGDGQPDPDATFTLGGGDDAGATVSGGGAVAPALDGGSAAAPAADAGAPARGASDAGKS